MLDVFDRILSRRSRTDSVRGSDETERLLHEVWLARSECERLQLQLGLARARVAQYEGVEPQSPAAAKGLPVEPMSPLPTNPDDPRLENWYHTIELAPGIFTKNAMYDHRPVVDLIGLPESLAGKSALDVATADGFWAFELERRGADRVVALDIVEMGDSDVIPLKRAQLPDSWTTSVNYTCQRFATAHAMRQSQVEFRAGNVYTLAPETVGTFDVVYCGDLLVHLFNPLQALCRIRSVTREMAIIETVAFQDQEYESVERHSPDFPLMWFGSRDAEQDDLGKFCMYWRFTEKALCDMMMYAGFSRTEPKGRYRFTGPGGGNLMMTSVIGYV